MPCRLVVDIQQTGRQMISNTLSGTLAFHSVLVKIKRKEENRQKKFGI
jgi:hypothetical protein